MVSSHGSDSGVFYLGDHFCPIVPVLVARENRARRMSVNRNRDLMRKG